MNYYHEHVLSRRGRAYLLLPWRRGWRRQIRIFVRSAAKTWRTRSNQRHRRQRSRQHYFVNETLRNLSLNEQCLIVFQGSRPPPFKKCFFSLYNYTIHMYTLFYTFQDKGICLGLKIFFFAMELEFFFKCTYTRATCPKFGHLHVKIISWFLHGTKLFYTNCEWTVLKLFRNISTAATHSVLFQN